MRYFPFFLIFLMVFNHNTLHSAETCSRIAQINYQEILVDSNASQKGEGLRYHLEKDAIAKEYLDTYQKNSAIQWPSAVLGTAASGLILSGFFSSNSQDRQVYLISGAAAVLINFFVARTIEFANEKNLKRSIEEYNKRNLPKIYFNPENNIQSNSSYPSIKVGLIKDWSF